MLIIDCVIKGQYVGFDEEQLTCDSGGKGLAVEAIKKFHKTLVYNQ